jgi:hypothetical protein
MFCLSGCINYLEETVNKYTSENGKIYPIYICANCKRYYIKVSDIALFEVEHDSNRWFMKVS